MAAYYNEFEPFAAAWLRELIKRDLIAPGDVDERSIKDVRGDDVRGYRQCHFFAGIGVWSYALFNAGWGDSDPVWTGSCPCQPFSPAGKGKGFNDDRHLWPEFFRLIGECRPDVVFGEQTASPAGLKWLDLVSDDLEGIGYAIGAANFPAASVGAPHIRQRLYWVAHPESLNGRLPVFAGGSLQEDAESQRNSEAGVLADAHLGRSRGDAGAVFGAKASVGREMRRVIDGAESGGPARGVADANGRLAGNGVVQRGGKYGQRAKDGSAGLVEDAQLPESSRHGQHSRSGLRVEKADGLAGSGGARGWWRDADWLLCTDQKYRPIEPGTFPLVAGTPARLGRLRGYGNALNAEQAKAFIEAYLDVRGAA